MPVSDRPQRIALFDHGGHPFTFQLAQRLNDLDSLEAYGWTGGSAGPKGSEADLRSSGVCARKLEPGFNPQGIANRLISEIRLGFALRRWLRDVQPGTDVAVLCQVPVLSLALAVVARRSGAPLVAWVQDDQSILASLTSKPLGAVLGRVERWAIGRADGAICASETLAAGPATSQPNRTLLANWPPALTPRPERVEGWSDVDLRPAKRRIVYAGSVGVKHRPLDLLRMAELFADAPTPVDVLVVGEGAGLDQLRNAASGRGMPSNLRLLPFQDQRHLDNVLGAGDVLLVTLDDDASAAAFPSKVLSYLQAERPVLGLMPSHNETARLIQMAGAGAVVSTPEAAVDVVTAASDDELRRWRVAAGEYAQRNLALDTNVVRFRSAVSTLTDTAVTAKDVQ